MTFASRTEKVRCKECKQGLMEILVDDKTYGPYQQIAHTKRSDESERNWKERETIFFHHLVDKEKGCNCFADRSNPFTYYNVFSKGESGDSYKEEEKINCRIIWHEVTGFSDDELKNDFEFVCCHCKRKGTLESFECYY